MTDGSHPPASTPGDRAATLITWLFRGILAAAVLLALMILLLPAPAFLAYSNYLQIGAAVAGSLAFLYCRGRCGHDESFLWASGGLALWGIANIGWYVNVMVGLRALVFPSIIDLGMIACFFLLAAGLRKGFPAPEASPYLFLGIIAASLIVPAAVILATGASTASVVTLLYFLACGVFLAAGLRYPGTRHTILLAGSLLFALAFMVYPLREQFFVQVAFLNIIGTMVAAGFALIVPGWLSAAGCVEDR
jgi:hypothetical protein